MYHLNFFSMQSHINKETSWKPFDIKCIDSQGMQKWRRNGKIQVFKKLSLAFNKVWFLKFVDINVEKFAGVNFAIAVTETLYFWHQFYLTECEFLETSFLKWMWPSYTGTLLFAFIRAFENNLNL